MPSWRPPPLDAAKPAYLALADALVDAVASGVLKPEARLPTVRELASALGVATATVLAGYREARRRGLIGGTVGRGTFISSAPEAHEASRAQFAARGFLGPDLFDLRSNVVPAPREWADVRGVLPYLPSPRRQTALLASAYTIDQSTEPETLREAGAHWAALCGLDADPRQMLIAAGGQHALAAALCTIGGAGTVLAVPAVTNSGVLIAARLFGIRLAAVRVGRDGIDADHLDHVCRTTGATAFYCAPAGGNPIPTPMVEAQRVAVGRIAEKRRLWLIEDDSPGPLVERLPPLARRWPQLTLWMGSVAQSLGFGFRLAFARVPAALEAGMQESLRALAWTGATPGALLSSEALADGTAARVFAARRAAIAERHGLVREVLGTRRVIAAPGIPYVWFETPPGWSADALHRALLLSGVAVAPAAQFAADPRRPPRGVRISAGALLSLDQYREALRRIADARAHPGRFRPPRPYKRRV